MNKFKRKALFTLPPLMLFVVVSTAAVQVNADLKKVTVYFWEFNHEGSGDDMIPFARYVDKKAPLRPTIEALIIGPTKEENPDKFSSVAYGDVKLSSVEVRRGTARIDFTRPVRNDYNPGDLETLRFEDAVIRTAKQFPEIKKVIVCVNGINEFGIGMVEDAPKPCPKKW